VTLAEEMDCHRMYADIFYPRQFYSVEVFMSKTVTLRLDEPVYRLFKDVAEQENRPISNFIETAVMRFVREHETVDEFEMAEIRGNVELNRSLKRGHQDAKQRRGTFA
jgi:predicted transcriptional regulator